MNVIKDILILLKYSLLIYKNYFKRHYYYAIISIISYAILLLLLLEISKWLFDKASFKTITYIFSSENSAPVLLLDSIKLFSLFAAASLYDAAALFTISNDADGISHMPLAPGTTSFLCWICILIGNPVNYPAFFILPIILLNDIFSELYSIEKMYFWIPVLFILFLIFKYIFHVFTVSVFRILKKFASPNASIAIYFLSASSAIYFLFFIDAQAFYSDQSVINLCEWAGNAIGIFIPTLWLMSIIKGLYPDSAGIALSDIIYVATLFLSAAYINFKMPAGELFRIKLSANGMNEETTTDKRTDAVLNYEERSPEKAIAMLELTNFPLKIFISGLTASSAAGYYFSNPEMPAFFILAFVFFNCSFISRDWPLIISMKSHPVDFKKIYRIKSLVFNFINFCLLAGAFSLIGYFEAKHPGYSIYRMLLLYFSFLWIKQIDVEMSFFMADHRSFKMSNIPVKKSINLSVIYSVYLMLFMVCAGFLDTADKYFIGGFLLVMAVLHLSIHYCAVRRFKKGEFND
ncbi:MAG: hypothetical protein ACD_47C00193G0002 [uncultured bacterium]|nr:MAG: hypothetical protein ACD_47C00193G0002 [uncultured bacterium]